MNQKEKIKQLRALLRHERALRFQAQDDLRGVLKDYREIEKHMLTINQAVFTWKQYLGT